MARPSRIEFAGVLYHIATRGDRREAIFDDDEARETFLGVLAEVMEQDRGQLNLETAVDRFVPQSTY